MSDKNEAQDAGGEVQVHIVNVPRESVKKADQYTDVRAKGEQAGGEIIEWPYSPETLYEIFESSALLQPNVGAYCANIDQMGSYFEPVVPLGTDTDALLLRRVLFEDAVVQGSTRYSTIDSVPESELEPLRSELLSKQMRDEVMAESFLRNCGGDVSFLRLRAAARQDLEVVGNAFWEVLRTGEGKIGRFVRVLPSEIKICSLSSETYPVREWKRVSRRRVESTTVQRRIRRYVIQSGSETRYLKEYRSQAVVSSHTGKIFATREEFEAWRNTSGNSADVPANEAIHFSNQTNLSDPYGVPRWIGALFEVLGAKSVAEYNKGLFDNGLLVPMLIMISGGTLSPASKTMLTEYLKGLKGVANAHRAAVLEATSGTSTAVPTVTVKELSGMSKEGGFLEYDKRNEDRVGSQFRISDIVRGNTSSTQNRATAEAALAQADQQVFGPIRQEFDWFFSNQILPELGVSSLYFVSRGVVHSDEQGQAELALEAVQRSVITPNEARELLEAFFDRSFSQIDEPWANQPPDVYRMSGAALAPSGTQSPSPPASDAPQEPEDLLSEINRLIQEGRALASRELGARAREAATESLLDLGLNDE